MELKRAYEAVHKTTAFLPIGEDENGQPVTEAVEIWFRPITGAILDQLDEEHAKKQMSLVEAKALTLSKELVRWSVTTDGEAVAPTLDVLKTLNRLQLDALLEAVNDFTFPKKTT